MRNVTTVAILTMLMPFLLHAQQGGDEAEQSLAKRLQNESVLQLAKQLLAHPKAESDDLLNFITNKLIRPEIDIVPSTLDPRTVRDMRHVVRTIQLSEFACTLSLPWGMPTRYTVSTNTAGIPFLHAHLKPGVTITFWDPNSPSEVDLFFQQDVPSTALRVGLDQDTLQSPISLWSRALHCSSRDVSKTHSVPRLAEIGSLLIYKACIWPFKTDTVLKFEEDGTTVFQIGSPEKDGQVMLEFFSGGKHATVHVQAVKKSVRITQRDIIDMIKGFRMTREDRTPNSSVRGIPRR